MSERTRVLLIEDDPDDADLTLHGIANKAGDEFDVQGVATLAEAMPVLAGTDLVLLDLGLPDVVSEFDGLDRIVAHSDVPVIVLTGESEFEDVAPQAALHGTTDTVFKRQASTDDLLRSMRTVRNRAAFRKAAERTLAEELGTERAR